MIRSIQRKQSTFIYRTFSAFMVVAFIDLPPLVVPIVVRFSANTRLTK